MKRAALFAAVAALTFTSGCAAWDDFWGGENAQTEPARAAPAPSESVARPPGTPQQSERRTFTQSEIAAAAEGFFGDVAEGEAEVVARLFRERGDPVGYIQGEEAAGAVGVGLRYGQGTLTLANGQTREVFWQGPSIGFDTGANAAKVFTLVYGMNEADQIYQRFPGVSGSAYFIGGVGVNYQQNGDIVLAPMRAGVGIRAGVNVGYLHYTRERQILPL